MSFLRADGRIGVPAYGTPPESETGSQDTRAQAHVLDLDQNWLTHMKTAALRNAHLFNTVRKDETRKSEVVSPMRPLPNKSCIRLHKPSSNGFWETSVLSTMISLSHATIFV